MFTSQYVSCFPVPFFFVTLFFKVNHHESPAEKLLQNGNILIYFVCVSTVCSVVLQRADEFLVDSCIYVSFCLVTVQYVSAGCSADDEGYSPT